MNKNHFQSCLAVFLAAGSMTLSTFSVVAQDASTNTSVASGAVSTDASPGLPSAAPLVPAATPSLGYGTSQILRLAQAKVGDDTIITYVRSSGNSYSLNADQIIYLRQQGVSSAVLNTMLTQPTTGVLPPLPATPAPAPVAGGSSPAAQPAAPSSIVGPSVTAIDPTAAAASSTYYYYYPSAYYSYPYPAFGYYGWYPGVSVSFGWRGGWGGGWHGGGAWHGGGWHGGGHR